MHHYRKGILVLQQWPNVLVEVGAHFGKRWHGNDVGRRAGKVSLGNGLPETPAAVAVVAFQAKRDDIELIAPAGAVAKLAPGRHFEPVEFKTLDVDCHVRFTGKVEATLSGTRC